jgi:hypothetical protein
MTHDGRWNIGYEGPHSWTTDDRLLILAGRERELPLGLGSGNTGGLKAELLVEIERPRVGRHQREYSVCSVRIRVWTGADVQCVSRGMAYAYIADP